MLPFVGTRFLRHQGIFEAVGQRTSDVKKDKHNFALVGFARLWVKKTNQAFKFTRHASNRRTSVRNKFGKKNLANIYDLFKILKMFPFFFLLISFLFNTKKNVWKQLRVIDTGVALGQYQNRYRRMTLTIVHGRI